MSGCIATLGPDDNLNQLWLFDDKITARTRIEASSPPVKGDYPVSGALSFTELRITDWENQHFVITTNIILESGYYLIHIQHASGRNVARQTLISAQQFSTEVNRIANVITLLNPSPSWGWGSVSSGSVKPHAIHSNRRRR